MREWSSSIQNKSQGLLILESFLHWSRKERALILQCALLGTNPRTPVLLKVPLGPLSPHTVLFTQPTPSSFASSPCLGSPFRDVYNVHSRTRHLSLRLCGLIIAMM